MRLRSALWHVGPAVVISLLAFAGLPASPSPEVSVGASPAPFAALAFDVFAGGDIWAANGGGIWRSDDGGRHWHDITPANLVGDDAAVRLSGFGSFGSQDLWLSANEAGDVTRQGLRGFAVERSTDGGRSWHWTALPSCGGCNMSFSFLGPAHGFALGSNGELYRTADGGATWSVVASGLPKSELPQVDFVSTHRGWATSGRRLEETSDGGNTWRSVPLPGPPGRIVALSAPHFFNASRGVVAAALRRGKGVVHETGDGGRHWQARPLPAPPRPLGASPGWSRAPVFQVASPATWAMTSGRRLYVTSDSGRSWSEVPTPATYGKGDPVWGFAMSSAASGWLAAATTPCGQASTDLCAVPVLMRTTDGGRTWRTVPSDARAAPVGFAPRAAARR